MQRYPRDMNSDIKRRVCAIQATMAESATSCFVEGELDDLRCLIRLTVEFFYYLRFGMDPLDRDRLNYTCESIFSGIDSFCCLCAAYGVLRDTVNSEVKWEDISLLSLKEKFISLFDRFDAEACFEKKCRLLLDLFKLQIVFAGLWYDCD
jgi:hypothetical protein